MRLKQYFSLVCLLFITNKTIADDDLNKAKTLLEELRNKTILSIAAHQKDFTMIENRLNVYIREIKKSQENIKEISNIYSKDIDILKNMPNNTANITECIDINDIKLKKLVTVAFDGLLKCIRSDTDITTSIVTNDLEDITNGENSVNNLDYELSECEQNPSCIQHLIGKILYAKQQIPTNFFKKVLDNILLVEKAFTRIKECGGMKITQIADEGRKFVEDAQNCLYEKLVYSANSKSWQFETN